MFKKNTKHTQSDIFGLFNTLLERMKKKIEKSEEYTFYRLIFYNIKEDIFLRLYSDKKSRPNAPINAMMSSFILMHRYNWTYEELFKNIEFNILTKIDNVYYFSHFLNKKGFSNWPKNKYTLSCCDN